MIKKLAVRILSSIIAVTLILGSFSAFSLDKEMYNKSFIITGLIKTDINMDAKTKDSEGDLTFARGVGFFDFSGWVSSPELFIDKDGVFFTEYIGKVLDEISKIDRKQIVKSARALFEGGISESSKTSKEKADGENLFEGYTKIEVDGGDLSGYRQPGAVVDIGFGDREYWAFTNEHGQLVKVVADQIILQDEENELVTSAGRYYHDEAKVPGTELPGYDEGHVIADSLGGTANAYNITPQNSTLNRHGDQAYMEDNIRKAGGCTDFIAIITYPDIKTQIPSHYKYTYTINENKVTDSFYNVDPDESVSSGVNIFKKLFLLLETLFSILEKL